MPDPEDRARRVKALFEEALEHPPERRGVFLAEACADEDVRGEVEDLLEALEGASAFLTEPAPATEERAGSVVGRYQLLEPIGEGGFGVVWMAEQREPVRRKVALKVIKAGMDTRQVVARFEVERQALAMMEHPNIARVLDGGATPSGRPYFVMELVPGLPITEFCDRSGSSPRERLELFGQVCLAVQHAHQKGVIHRDLKPGNVLVTMHDGVPVPKVIDFGIAKATDQELTRRTLFTGFRQMVGTPEYMAPEQAGISGLDVDTRADVYGLGVLLYELLTGTVPFALEELAEQGYSEMLRHIREVEPPRPSTRVGSLGGRLAEVARERRTPPERLGRVLRGELDWIVMRALEKDRNRRYPTARAFAEDVRRYLEDLPVEAGPPSAAYRIAKMVHRHRMVVAAGVLVFLSLVAGVVGTGVSLTRAWKAEALERKQRERAEESARQARIEAGRAAAALARAREAERQERAERQRMEESERVARREAQRATRVLLLLRDLLGSADPHGHRHPDDTLRELLDEFDRRFEDQLAGLPAVEADLRRILGSAYLNLGLHDKAQRHLRRALDLLEDLPEEGELLVGRAATLGDWSLLLHDRGRYEEAAGHLEEGLELLGEVPGDEARRWRARLLRSLADMYRHLARYDEAGGRIGQALAIHGEIPDADELELASVLDVQGMLAGEQGDHVRAEELLRRALALRRDRLGGHPVVATTLNNLGTTLGRLGRFDEGEEVLRESLAMRRKLFDADHPLVAGSLNNLALNLASQGKDDEAAAMYAEAIAILERRLPPHHPNLAFSRGNLARILQQEERWQEAEALQRQALASLRLGLGPGHPAVAAAAGSLAHTLGMTGRGEEALPLLEEMVRIRRRALPEGHPQVGLGLAELAMALHGTGESGRAAALLEKALAILEADGTVPPRYVARTLQYLGHVATDRGRFDRAGEWYRRARAVWTGLPDADPLDAVAATIGLGRVLLAGGRAEPAEELLEEALAVLAEHDGDSWKRWWVQGLLGDALAGQQRLAEAEELVREAAEELEGVPGSAPRRREVVARLVALYRALGRPRDAASWQEKLTAEEDR